METALLIIIASGITTLFLIGRGDDENRISKIAVILIIVLAISIYFAVGFL